MNNYSVKPYTVSDYDQWNDFIQSAKNATFLFHRDFMEYHNDRFKDFSLIVMEGEKWMAVIPGNCSGDVFFSHQGLTYGGMLMGGSPGGEKTEAMMEAVEGFLKEKGFREMRIKMLPAPYHKKPSFELDYFLYKKGADLYRREMNLMVDYSSGLILSKSKRKYHRQASLKGLVIKQDNDFTRFWQEILVPRLKEKHNSSPVHSLEEILLLHQRFPENILQYNVYYEEAILAGITLFVTDKVVKSQYGATSALGETYRALDYLFVELLLKYSRSKAFFDMGTANEANGKEYHKGMLKQKEELGCSIYPHDYYVLAL